MWAILSNTVTTHLATGLIGAAAAWYATHRTIAKTIEAAIASAVTALKTAASDNKAAV